MMAVLGVSSSAIAAPVNDAFANRLPIFNGTSNAVTGSNVGATLEAGEPIPTGYTSTNYQGTIWYEFQPVVDDWWEVTTVGSDFDTVISVWTGPSFASLFQVHVNDEAVEGKVSRLRFPSSGGGDTSYYIAVAGKGGARGNVKLTVLSRPDPMITSLSSVSINPTTVDVASAAASTTFTTVMSVNGDVASGYVKLYSPSGILVSTATYSVANRVGSSNLNATYHVTLTVPRYLVPGAYMLGFEAQDAISSPSKVESYGWDQLTALAAMPTLTVQNTATDSYTQFVQANGLFGASADKSADPDRDGVENLAEFGFGLDPNAVNLAPLIATGGNLTRRGLPNTYVTGTGVQARLRVEFIRRLSDPLVTYQVEFSDDLVHWMPATNPAVVLATGTGYEAVSVDDVTTGSVRPRRFSHVLITYALP